MSADHKDCIQRAELATALRAEVHGLLNEAPVTMANLWNVAESIAPLSLDAPKPELPTMEEWVAWAGGVYRGGLPMTNLARAITEGKIAMPVWKEADRG